MASTTQGDEQPNKSEIEVLQDELSSLAYEWRRLASLGYDEEASHVCSAPLKLDSCDNQV